MKMAIFQIGDSKKHIVLYRIGENASKRLRFRSFLFWTSNDVRFQSANIH